MVNVYSSNVEHSPSPVQVILVSLLKDVSLLVVLIPLAFRIYLPSEQFKRNSNLFSEPIARLPSCHIILLDVAFQVPGE